MTLPRALAARELGHSVQSLRIIAAQKGMEYVLMEQVRYTASQQRLLLETLDKLVAVNKCACDAILKKLDYFWKMDDRELLNLLSLANAVVDDEKSCDKVSKDTILSIWYDIEQS